MVKILLKKNTSKLQIHKLSINKEYIKGRHIIANECGCLGCQYYEYGWEINGLREGRFYNYYPKELGKLRRRKLRSISHYHEGKLHGWVAYWTYHTTEYELFEYTNYKNGVKDGFEWLNAPIRGDKKWELYKNGKSTKTFHKRPYPNIKIHYNDLPIEIRDITPKEWIIIIPFVLIVFGLCCYFMPGPKYANKMKELLFSTPDNIHFLYHCMRCGLILIGMKIVEWISKKINLS